MPMDGPTPRAPRLRDIPRDAWPSHPHYPNQVLLLGSHDNFRRLSRLLVDHADREDSVDWIASLFSQWIGAMRSHEAYEERKLYPFLTRRWGLSFDQAEAGHRELHDCDGRVRAALAERRAGTGPPAALRRALDRHDTVLREHLDHEEQLVIPALLELSPREFADYYRS